jgi:hypothetical protein
MDEDIEDINILEKDVMKEIPEVDEYITSLLSEDMVPCKNEDIVDSSVFADLQSFPKTSALQQPSALYAPKGVPSTPLINIKKNTALQSALSNPAENDALVDVIRREASSSTILNAVMEEMAEEAAFIKAWRNNNWDGTADLSEATGKRIKMLKDIVETLVEKEKLKKEKNVGKVDFYGDNFQRVLKHFLEVIQKTFKKVSIPAQFEDIFFTQLAKEFDGFEKSAEKIYYGKDK